MEDKGKSNEKNLTTFDPDDAGSEAEPVIRDQETQQAFATMTFSNAANVAGEGSGQDTTTSRQPSGSVSSQSSGKGYLLSSHRGAQPRSTSVGSSNKPAHADWAAKNLAAASFLDTLKRYAELAKPYPEYKARFEELVRKHISPNPTLTQLAELLDQYLFGLVTLTYIPVDLHLVESFRKHASVASALEKVKNAYKPGYNIAESIKRRESQTAALAIMRLLGKRDPEAALQVCADGLLRAANGKVELLLRENSLSRTAFFELLEDELTVIGRPFVQDVEELVRHNAHTWAVYSPDQPNSGQLAALISLFKKGMSRIEQASYGPKTLLFLAKVNQGIKTAFGDEHDREAAFPIVMAALWLRILSPIVDCNPQGKTIQKWMIRCVNLAAHDLYGDPKLEQISADLHAIALMSIAKLNSAWHPDKFSLKHA